MLETTDAPYGHILSAGKLAYLDSFAGLVPCKVLSVRVEKTDMGNEIIVADVKLTATRGAYLRCEVLTSQRAVWVIPRKAVYVRSGQYRISGGIVPVPDSEIVQ